MPRNAAACATSRGSSVRLAALSHELPRASPGKRPLRASNACVGGRAPILLSASWNLFNGTSEQAVDLHLLRFKTTSDLLRSFDEASSHDEVEDCLVRLDRRELRMRAPDELARELIERAYDQGGLAWHSRHRELELV